MGERARPPMIPKPLAAIDAGGLQALVDAGVPESRVLEFQRDLNVAASSERIDFLAHVSSFANATGGNLIYGIDAPNGTAAGLPGLAVTNPDEAIVTQQVEDEPGGTPIGLRLAHSHGANLRGIADEQRVLAALHERVEPDCVARALNPDRHGPRQRGIELFDRRPLVYQLVLAHLPVSVSSTATCCVRVCRSHPTNVMASASFRRALSPRASIATARDRPHDISSGPPSVPRRRRQRPRCAARG
jgi:hypothetical protein